MDAAGVLPAFGGIACHYAWAPHDCYDGAAGHALCNAHVLRELTAVTETGATANATWARQAIDALLALKKAADAGRAEGLVAVGGRPWRGTPAGSARRWPPGTVMNAGRRAGLQKKRHTLALRMAAREAATSASPVTCGVPS
jgi:transposase